MICPPPYPRIERFLCLCGCGQKTTLIKLTDNTRGYVIGQYTKYVSGHNSKGRKRSPESIAKQTRRGSEHWNYGRKASSETRAKMSEAHRGEKAWNWKGGYDGGNPNQRGRWTPEFKAWRKEVFERDRFTCQKCGKTGGYLNAHHIMGWARYPALRYIVSNGKTLCKRPCHIEEHARRGK